MWHAANIQINEFIALMKEAGEKVINVYNQEQENWEINFKTDMSPLTMADKVSNKTICSFLKKKYPEFPVISEENKEIPYSIRKNYTLMWLVDPLDGTKEFIKRNGEFTINIALIEGTEPTFGIVYIPVTGIIYYAIKGAGAYKIENHNLKQIKVKSFKLNDKGLGVVASRSHNNEETKTFIEKLNAPEIINRGSSLKFLMIAEGTAHLYPRLGPTMEWDTAAAQIIVEEAGGKVIDFESEQKLYYNKSNLLNPDFLVMGNKL